MVFKNKVIRNELKYYLNYNEYLTLKRKLPNILKRDVNSKNEMGYQISSLYFDDYYNNALYEKNYGILLRKKYRIRIYDGSDKKIKLERKNKYDNHTSKDITILTRDEYEKIIKGDINFLKHSENKLKIEFYAELVNNGLKPKIIVKYRREAYFWDSYMVRITFDNDLTAVIGTYDLFDKNGIGFNVINPELVIMEVKYGGFLPEHIRSIIQTSSHNISSISKYILCREKYLVNT